MHKFTLITILLTLTIIAITIDVLFNGYKVPKDYIPEHAIDAVSVEDIRVKANEKSLKESIVTDTITIPETLSENSPSTKIIEDVKTISDGYDTNGAETSVLKSIIEYRSENSLPTVELLKESGLDEPVLKSPAQSDFMLQVIPLNEEWKKNIKVANLFDFERYLGTMYALQTTQDNSAKKLYSDLKALCLTLEDVTVKEVNAMGDQSFYVNQIGKSKTAFSIVRVGTYVYGLEYPHSSHTIMKSVIMTLKKHSEPQTI